MWKLVQQSVQGTSHLRLGIQCQDCCRSEIVQLADEEVAILVCADGAGSSAHSAEGSQIVCESFLEIVKASLAGDPGELVECLAAAWLNQVRERITAAADAKLSTPREFASTLLGAVITTSHALFMQIGDGAIIVHENDEYRPIFWPQAGEYAGTTNFVSSDVAQEALMTRLVELSPGSCRIAMLTDGLERLALRFATREAHSPFFEPLFEAIEKAEEPANLAEPLAAFLASAAVNERTDDDKTLLLALRV